MLPTDFMETHHEAVSHKRLPNKDLSTEPPTKAGRTDSPEGESLLVSRLHRVWMKFSWSPSKKESPQRCLQTNFQKKCKVNIGELHHSNNPPELQEAVDQTTVVEWRTLQDEKQALVVIPPDPQASSRPGHVQPICN